MLNILETDVAAAEEPAAIALAKAPSAAAKPPPLAQLKSQCHFTQPKPHQKTQLPGAECKARNTTLRRKAQFPSLLFRRKNQASRALPPCPSSDRKPSQRYLKFHGKARRETQLSLTTETLSHREVN
jgi:hypothetical protein